MANEHAGDSNSLQGDVGPKHAIALPYTVSLSSHSHGSTPLALLST